MISPNTGQFIHACMMVTCVEVMMWMEAGGRMDGPTCSIDNLLTMSIVMLYEH